MKGRFTLGASFAQMRRRRSGQTTTEYALILAYVSIAAIQVMSNLSVFTTETIINANCDLIIAQSSSLAVAQANIINYLETYNYGNYSEEDKIKIFTACYTNAMNTIAQASGTSST